MNKFRFFQLERADDRRFFGEWCLLTLAALIIVGLGVKVDVFRPLGNIIYDSVQRIRVQEPNHKIIIVAIDDRSLSELGGWPLSRHLYAQFLKNLADSGNIPKAIGFDVLMIDPRTEDQELGQQMARLRVILPVELRLKEGGGSPINLPPLDLAKSASVLAHVNVSFDDDGVIRGSRLLDSGVPHFSLAMSGMGARVNSLTANYVRFSLIAPDAGFPTISFSDALQENYPLSIFKDAYVVIGATAPSLGDHYPSIYAGKQKSGTPGLVFQASLLNDLLQKKIITSATLNISLIAYGISLCVILLGILLLTPSTELILTLMVVFAGSLLSAALLLENNYWLDPSPLIAAVLLIKPIWAWRRMTMIVHFMQKRAQDIRSYEVTAIVGGGRLMIQDAVLQYSNILDRAIQMAKNRLEHFEKIINDLPEAIFILNEEGQLLLANEKFQSLFFTRKYDERLSIDTLLGYLGYSLKHIEALLEMPLGHKYLKIKADEACFKEYMVHRVQLEFEAGGNFSLIMFVEVTALLQFQMHRDRTLQLLSHDMRTPVASILTLCRKLLIGQDPLGEVGHSVKQITSHSKRLLTMMDDFILSIKADESEYSLTDVLFDSLLDQAIYEVKDLADERQMNIKVESDYLDAFVQVQSRLMERVLINLFVNAIRYGKLGSEILIRVSKNILSEKHMLQCQVINAIGVDEKLNQIEVENKGFGLGLNFIDQVIARHHGSITRHLPADGLGDLAMITIEIPCNSKLD